MDSTYKTNKYRLPLLEIVGVTSTGLTFSAAFVLMSSERENNYTWALQKLRGLFFRGDVYPTVIVSDRDLALMNVIQNVFPEACNLLCRFHINKNVKVKCKMLVHPREAWDVVMKAWTSVIDCKDCEAFPKCVEGFESACLAWPIFFEYVRKTWITPHKEKFVFAWTNKVMHMGNTTFRNENVNRMASHPVYKFFPNCKSDAGHPVHTNFVFSDEIQRHFATQTSN